MKILDLKQNSDEWIEARLNHFCASEAPAMMGESKFMSRSQLLDIKAGWKRNPDSSFKAMLFQKGHEYEAEARKITELEYCDDFPPIVGEAEINEFDARMLASFDGKASDLAWEHKAWNAVLAENVRNGLLEPHYYWQLEHQCLVAGIDLVIFTCSDGTTKNRVSMVYTSQPERRKALIAGWRQFAEDLKNHELEAKVEVVEADQTALPIVTYSVQGTEITSDISEVVDKVKQLAALEMGRKLESDQDFANKESLNKAVKKSRDLLKSITVDVRNKFSTFAQFDDTAKLLDSVLQKMQSHGEKQVKEEKERKKSAIIADAKIKLASFIQECEGQFYPLVLRYVISTSEDFEGAVKNKRTISSLVDAVDTELARVKVEIGQVVDKVRLNYDFFKSNAADYNFLFNDLNQLISAEHDGFKAIIKTRISEHKTAESERVEALKLQAEAEAKAKAEREAEAVINAEREKIRAEERAKAKAEAEQSTLMIATKPHEQVNAVTAGVNEYLVRTEWFGYSRGYSVYKVTAESEDVALDNYKLGSIVESVTVKSDIEDNDVAILKGKNQ